MDVADFLTKELVTIKPSANTPDSYIVKDDTLNYKGESLFRTYSDLWQAVNEWDIGVVTDTFRIEQLFHKLASFPFVKVSEIMTDYVRKLLRHALSYLWLPYTSQQAESVTRALTEYPKTKQEKELVESILSYIEAIHTSVSKQLSNPNALVPTNTLDTYIEELVSRLYTLPEHLYWLVVSKFNQMKNTFTTVYNKHLKMDTVAEFLLKKTQSVQHLYRPFEERLVNDVNTLLGFDYIHVEVYHALKALHQVLDMYYTPVQRSKLFIDNVEWKMIKYFGKVEGTLSVDELSQSQTIQAEPKATLTLEQRYEAWLQAIKNHQLDGSHKREVLEGANYFKQRAYHEVVQLPNFNEMIWYVNSLTL